MNPFSDRIYSFIRKYELLFVGLILGFVIFLALSLSAINVILFLLLGTFVETTLIYFAVSPKNPKQTIENHGHILMPNSKQRGRPKGSKNKPKETTA